MKGNLQSILINFGNLGEVYHIAPKTKEITISEIINKYSNEFKVIPKNMAKYFDEKILKLNNLSIGNLDHNQLEFLQLKGLLDKDLIKPLYLS